MATTYTEYITQPGDRWDLIAYKAYGDAIMIDIIAQANPSIPLTPILDSGIVMFIPVQAAATIDTNLLSPWKR